MRHTIIFIHLPFCWLWHYLSDTIGLASAIIHQQKFRTNYKLSGFCTCVFTFQRDITLTA